MGKQPGSELASLDQYERAGGYMVLHPVVQFADGVGHSPLLAESVSVVTINPTEGSGEVYHDFRYANERDGKAALSGLALAKIAAAAGIKWIPDLCRVLERERRADGHVYLRYQAGGAVRQPNGEWHVEIAEKDIDTADEAEQMADAYRRKLASGRAKYKVEDIPDMVRRDVMQLREFLLGHAETKAKNRVIRRMLTLKQVYTRQELQRPFVVPRLIYRPDLTDPRELERVQLEGRSAAESLYGAPSLPASTQASGAVGEGVGSDASQEPPARQQAAGGATGSSTGKGSDGNAAPAAAADNSEAETSTREEVKQVDDRPEPPGWGEAAKPKNNPVFQDGQYKGQTFEVVSQEHPEFMRAIAETGRTKIQREAAAEWIAFWDAYKNPTLGGDS